MSRGYSFLLRKASVWGRGCSFVLPAGSSGKRKSGQSGHEAGKPRSESPRCRRPDAGGEGPGGTASLALALARGRAEATDAGGRKRRVLGALLPRYGGAGSAGEVPPRSGLLRVAEVCGTPASGASRRVGATLARCPHPACRRRWAEAAAGPQTGRQGAAGAPSGRAWLRALGRLRDASRGALRTRGLGPVGGAPA